MNSMASSPAAVRDNGSAEKSVRAAPRASGGEIRRVELQNRVQSCCHDIRDKQHLPTSATIRIAGGCSGNSSRKRSIESRADSYWPAALASGTDAVIASKTLDSSRFLTAGGILARWMIRT